MAKGSKPKPSSKPTMEEPQAEAKKEGYADVAENGEVSSGWYRPPPQLKDYEIHFFVVNKSICGKYTGIDKSWKVAKRDPEKNDDCAACYSQQHIYTGKR